MSFTLAHISDVHLKTQDVKWHELVGKRVTGFVNWKVSRSQKYYSQALEDVRKHIKQQNPDHIAVTGDLINLGLQSEMIHARRWLKELGEPDDVSVVPGNHDAYVVGALPKIRKEWKDYMRGDEEGNKESGGQFPYIRRREGVAIIGVNSGCAMPPFISSGVLAQSQASRLKKALEENKDRFRIVLIHHPPFVIAPHKRLYGVRLFQQAIAEHGAELILHGHTHTNSVRWIQSKVGRVPVVPVVGVSAAGQVSKDAPTYNLFHIEGGKCEMQAFEWNNQNNKNNQNSGTITQTLRLDVTRKSTVERTH